jgi:hypothetical protein
MIGLNEKGLGTFRGPLLPLAYIRPNDRYRHLGMHFLDELRPSRVLNEVWAESYRRRMDIDLPGPRLFTSYGLSDWHIR